MTGERAHKKRQSKRRFRPTPWQIVFAIGALLIVVAAGFGYYALSSNRSALATAVTTTTSQHTGSQGTTTTTAIQPTTPGPQFSAAIQAENAKPGTSAWRISGYQIKDSIQGYTSNVSILPGQSFNLYVSTIEPSFTVTAFRMGWYQGNLARQIWQSKPIPGVSQPKCPLLRATNTIECYWKSSIKVTTNSTWFPGDYLLLLHGTNHQESYVPITIRQPDSNSAYLVINAVTTWQAYNTYGGYDLYHGPIGYSDRSTKVSFDRPYSYQFGQGAADFLGNEFPMVSLMEKLGLNVSYVTSVDLQRFPNVVKAHSVIISLGHDEYWSPQMRSVVTQARNRGTNLMFLGANAIFRRIRFDSSPLGSYRIEVNYRSAALDPYNSINQKYVTTNWPSPPAADPESSLIGIQYSCNPVHYPMVITDPSAWIFSGTGLTFGSRIPQLVGSEFDSYNPNYPTPKNLQIFAHSPVLCRNVPYFSDMSYYVASSGAGVFATGTNLWIASMTTWVCPPPLSGCPIAPVVKMTENVLNAFGSGPAGPKYPAISNAYQVYRHPPIPPLTPYIPPTTTTTTTTTIPGDGCPTSSSTTNPGSSTTSLGTSTTNPCSTTTTVAGSTTTTYPGETTTTTPSQTTTTTVSGTTTTTQGSATTTTTTTTAP